MALTVAYVPPRQDSTSGPVFAPRRTAGADDEHLIREFRGDLPEAATFESDPRIAECQANIDQTSGALIPEFKAIHPMEATMAARFPKNSTPMPKE